MSPVPVCISLCDGLSLLFPNLNVNTFDALPSYEMFFQKVKQIWTTFYTWIKFLIHFFTPFFPRPCKKKTWPVYKRWRQWASDQASSVLGWVLLYMPYWSTHPACSWQALVISRQNQRDIYCCNVFWHGETCARARPRCNSVLRGAIMKWFLHGV